MLKSLMKFLPPIRRLIQERDNLREALNFDSRYDSEAVIAAKVASGDHRREIGGYWDQMGQLQYDFMVAQGLQPTHRFLDIGCGCLREECTLYHICCQEIIGVST